MLPGLLEGVFAIGSKLLDRILPDPAAKAAAQMELLKLQQTGELAQLAAETDLAKLQIQTNIEEAKSTNWFVAGARPFIMWTCGAAFAYAAVIEPLLRFGSAVWWGYAGQFPVIDTSLTMQVLFGILGLGAMRSFEKAKNVEGNR